jgi:putative oxidoreductase
MKYILKFVLETVEDHRSLIPRILVGLVFLSEGIQKLLFPETLGAARFEKIGFANPEFLAAFVAYFEIVCGILVLIGFAVRISSLPLLIIICTAIVKTKIPMGLEEGFWKMAHEARTDIAMTLLIVFILVYGAGRLSADYLIHRKLQSDGS